jgi:hypothetical protein
VLPRALVEKTFLMLPFPCSMKCKNSSGRFRTGMVAQWHVPLRRKKTRGDTPLIMLKVDSPPRITDPVSKVQGDG